MSESPSTFGYGQLDPNDFANEFNVICFIVRQMTARMDTMKLVKVMAVAGGGGAIAAAGTVDVLPLVNQVDGNMNSTPHGTVYGIPWWRLQGGDGAVIVDPAVGDIGYVTVSDRDISSVKANRAQANPGSARRFDIADGVYVGGVLNGPPTQYLVFTANGLSLVDRNGNSIAMTSAGIVITDANGNVITANAAGISVADDKGNHITTAATGISIVDHFNNKLLMTSTGVEIDDVNGNTIKETAAGVQATDKFLNTITLSSTGANVTDLTGNVLNLTAAGIAIIPKAGLPATVTGILQVNGDLQIGGAIKAIGGGLYAGDLKTSGNVIAGFGGADQIGLQTHTHIYQEVVVGSSPAPTAAPTAGS